MPSSTSNDPVRPASRQTLHPLAASPASSRSPHNSTSFPKSNLTYGSTTSLVIPGQDVQTPKHPSPQGRRRAQSFSGQTSAIVVSRPNWSWPQTSTVKDVEQQSSCAPVRRRILFYDRHRPYYSFTNFSAYPVKYKGKTYPTSEHLFQSFKFQDHRPGLAEHIRLYCPRPSDAFSEARRFQPEVRPDWMEVNIQKMEQTLELKFNQHATLRAELLGTGDADLIEDSDEDAFWGVGADRRGRNELGKALQRLRARLREKKTFSNWRR